MDVGTHHKLKKKLEPTFYHIYVPMHLLIYVVFGFNVKRQLKYLIARSRFLRCSLRFSKFFSQIKKTFGTVGIFTSAFLASSAAKMMRQSIYLHAICFTD